MGLCSTNRLSFAGADLEFDMRPGSRFSGLNGLQEFCDILCERALLDDEFSSILEAEDNKNEDSGTNTPDGTGDKKEDEDKDKSSETEDKGDKEGKIAALFNKLIEAIKRAIANVKTKLLELTNKDVDLVVRFQKYLQDPKNLEGFEGVQNIQGRYLKIIDTSVEDLVKIKDGLKISDIYGDYIDKIASEKDQAKIDELKKQFEDELDKIKKENAAPETDKEKEENEKEVSEMDKEAANNYGTFGENGFIPSQDTLNKIAISLKNSKSFISGVDSLEKIAKDNFDIIRREYKLKVKQGNEDVIEDHKNKVIYDMSIKAGNMVGSFVSAAMKDTINGFNTIRKIWIVCGKYASIKGNKK